MNEIYAIDPRTCDDPHNFRRVVDLFGPPAGRYIARYPEDWESRVMAISTTLRPIDSERVKAVLRRMKEESRTVVRKNLAWHDDKEWINNALACNNTVPPIFSGLISDCGNSGEVFSVDNFSLPPTAEEYIASRPDEFARVARILLAISDRDVVFIDPYLDPRKRDRQIILEQLFQNVRCKELVFWARYAEIFKMSCSADDLREIETCLRKALSCRTNKGSIKVAFNFVEDEKCAEKLHARYLVTNKGGIRFDQGFQKLPNERIMDVSPIQPKLHQELLEKFVRGKTIMVIKRRIQFTLDG